jgi:hypothetical protein
MYKTLFLSVYSTVCAVRSLAKLRGRGKIFKMSAIGKNITRTTGVKYITNLYFLLVYTNVHV